MGDLIPPTTFLAPSILKASSPPMEHFKVADSGESNLTRKDVLPLKPKTFFILDHKPNHENTKSTICRLSPRIKKQILFHVTSVSYGISKGRQLISFAHSQGLSCSKPKHRRGAGFANLLVLSHSPFMRSAMISFNISQPSFFPSLEAHFLPPGRNEL